VQAVEVTVPASKAIKTLSTGGMEAWMDASFIR
jgi:hypothetical protein